MRKLHIRHHKRHCNLSYHHRTGNLDRKMLQRLFIHANVEAEMHERSSVIDDHHHELMNSSNDDNKKSSEQQHSGTKVVIIAATLYFIWIWVGIIFYKFYGDWTLGMSKTIELTLMMMMMVVMMMMIVILDLLTR